MTTKPVLSAGCQNYVRCDTRHVSLLNTEQLKLYIATLNLNNYYSFCCDKSCKKSIYTIETKHKFSNANHLLLFNVYSASGVRPQGRLNSCPASWNHLLATKKIEATSFLVILAWERSIMKLIVKFLCWNWCIIGLWRVSTFF